MRQHLTSASGGRPGDFENGDAGLPQTAFDNILQPFVDVGPPPVVLTTQAA
jgi:hypothetical protein